MEKFSPFYENLLSARLVENIEKPGSTLNIFRTKYDTKSFSISTDKFCSIDIKSGNSTILDMRTCFEIGRGVSIPVIAVCMNNSKPTETCIVLVAVNLDYAKRLVPIRKINNFGQLQACNWNSVQLVDGPALSVILNKKLYISSSIKENVCLQEFKCVAVDDNTEVSSVLWVKFLPEFQKYVFIIDQGKGLVFDLSNNNTSSLSLDNFFPEEYKNITLLHVCSYKVYGEDEDADHLHVNLLKTLHLLVVVDNEFLVKLNNGIVEFAIRLFEVENPMALLFIPSSINIEEEFYLVRGSEKTTIISSKQNKVLLSWENIKDCFSVGFLKNGLEQFFLISENFCNESGWILTDNCSLHLDKIKSTSIDLNSSESNQNESMFKVIESLQKRFQKEAAAISELKAKQQAKMDFIARNLEQLHLKAEGRPLKKSTPNGRLVPLIGKPKDSSCVETVPEQETSKSPFKILTLWQRIYDDCWIVGVDFQYQLGMPTTIFLSTIPRDRTVNCLVSKSIEIELNGKCKTPNISQEGKKPRLERVEIDPKIQELSPLYETALCTMGVPSFENADFSCTLVLHYKINDDSGKLASRNFCCGIVTLHAKDILARKHHINISCFADKKNVTIEQNRDLVALNCSQKEVHLKLISSTKISLPLVCDWLVSRSGFVHHVTFQCYVAKEEKAFPNVRIFVSDLASDMKSCKLKLHFKNTDEFKLLVHHLYDCFPDNIYFAPDNEEHKKKAEEYALQCMEEEKKVFDSLRNEMGAQGQNHKEQNEKEAVEKSDKGEINVDNVRSNFQKRKRILTEQSEINRERQPSEKAIEAVIDAQIKTDRAISALLSVEHNC